MQNQNGLKLIKLGVGKGEGLEKEKNSCPWSIPDLLKYTITLSWTKGTKLEKLKDANSSEQKPNSASF